MNKLYKASKNIAAQKGRIDPATTRDAERTIELSDKIEYWLDEYKTAIEGSTLKMNAERRTRHYARLYKEHTGDYFSR